MKYLILLLFAAVILLPKHTANQTINSFEKFCAAHMIYVKRYPLALDPGECV